MASSSASPATIPAPLVYPTNPRSAPAVIRPQLLISSKGAPACQLALRESSITRSISPVITAQARVSHALTARVSAPNAVLEIFYISTQTRAGVIARMGT